MIVFILTRVEPLNKFYTKNYILYSIIESMQRNIDIARLSVFIVKFTNSSYVFFFCFLGEDEYTLNAIWKDKMPIAVCTALISKTSLFPGTLSFSLYLDKVIEWMSERLCSSRWMPHAIVIRKTFAPSPLPSLPSPLPCTPAQQRARFTYTMHTKNHIKFFCFLLLDLGNDRFVSESTKPNSVCFTSHHFASTIHLKSISW